MCHFSIEAHSQLHENKNTESESLKNKYEKNMLAKEQDIKCNRLGNHEILMTLKKIPVISFWTDNNTPK